MNTAWKNAETLFDGILSGDRILLARALTLVESRKLEDREIAYVLLNKIINYSRTSSYKRIAISGSPGAGKSSLIEQLGITLAEKGKQVAVLAIDPSSQLTKGSILGDKTRMEQLGRHVNAFIRPSSAGDTLGGVAANTYASTLICAAAGFEYILIETVGVGQSETAARHLSDFFILLLLPGAGDELQGIKKGIMESTDLLFINKADGSLEEKAKETRAAYKHSLHLFPARADQWQVPVICGSALENRGIDELINSMENYFERNVEHIDQLRIDQGQYWFNELLIEKIKQFTQQNEELKAVRTELITQISAEQISPFEASEIMFKQLTRVWK
jgi:LAO/AO transport system kinase